MMISIKRGMISKLTWFTKSPDAGDPGCLCSLCGEPISEEECPFRMWTDKHKPMLEVRLHWKCFEKVTGSTVR